VSFAARDDKATWQNERVERDVVGPSEVVFASAIGRIGRFRISPTNPRFADTGPIAQHLVAFPRTAVAITHAGGPRMMADPTRAMIYNRGQEYRRGVVSPEGDRCEWFAFDAAAIADATAPWDASAAERLDRPFSRAWAPVDPRTYALQRATFERACAGGDAMAIEEAMLALLARVVRASFGACVTSGHAADRAATRRAHAEIVDEVQRILATRFREPLSLGAIARMVGASPFHLARVFRAHARVPIHAYRTQLRLRASLEALVDRRDITALALDLGFASHAHFTTAFRRAFGTTPSAWRGSSKNSKAR